MSYFQPRGHNLDKNVLLAIANTRRMIMAESIKKYILNSQFVCLLLFKGNLSSKLALKKVIFIYYYIFWGVD